MARAGPFPLVGGYEVVAWLRAHARELGEPAVPFLEVVATDGSTELRAAAVLALAEIGPARTEAFIVDRARNDADREVREAATRALGRGVGAESLAYLRATSEERAARIALSERATSWSARDLAGVVSGALEAEASEDRFARVCLEILAARREANTELVLDVMRQKPAFLSVIAAEGLSASIGADHQDEVLALIHARQHRPHAADEDREADEKDIDRAFAWMSRHAEPARVFEHLAPVVGSGHGGVLAAAIAEVLSEQANDAWTARDDRGVDDGEPPAAPTPDPRWRAVLVSYAPPAGLDFDVEIEPLMACLAWSEASESRASPSLRLIESGAEDGAAFVLAGFDVSEREDAAALAHALESFGPRSISNLHHVSHQCGGHRCSHFRLLGIPLGSAALSAELSPDSDDVVDLATVFQTESKGLALARAREVLRRYVPKLPQLADGLEALVWTSPAPLVEMLEGLSVVRILPSFQPWRESSGFWMPPPDAMRERGPFDDAQQRLLDQVGARLDLGLPRIFVLWASSD